MATRNLNQPPAENDPLLADAFFQRPSAVSAQLPDPGERPAAPAIAAALGVPPAPPASANTAAIAAPLPGMSSPGLSAFAAPRPPQPGVMTVQGFAFPEPPSSSRASAVSAPAAPAPVTATAIYTGASLEIAPPPVAASGLQAEGRPAAPVADFDDAPTRIVGAPFTPSPKSAPTVPVIVPSSAPAAPVLPPPPASLFGDNDAKTNVWQGGAAAKQGAPSHGAGVATLQPAKTLTDAPRAVIVGAQQAEPSQRGLVLGLALALSAALLLLIFLGIKSAAPKAPQLPSEPPAAAVAVTPTGGIAAAIFTQPAGATVTLDGQPVPSVTPLTIPNLQVGQAYKLAISLPGHQTLNDTIVVKDGQPIQRMLTLVQAVGSLTVLSTPPGAAISIDGVMRGLAPVTVDGIDSSRSHSVTATLSGYQSATVAAAWGQGEAKMKTISLPLAPLSKAVAPKVTEAPKPANAAVFGSPVMPAAVSKKPTAAPPAAPRAVAPPAPVKRPAAPVAAPAVPQRERPSAPAAPLRERPSAAPTAAPVSVSGSLTVRAIPYGQVWVDGRMVASETPLSALPLPPGDHRVKVYFVEPRAYSEERVVRIEPGQSATANFRYKP
ncbi:MAG: PEGA domain-containing protein [Deltaproteobacteria bacterium]|nr:PEGA domain-containing protein [Deltaproteobacteria bacterium]